MAKGNGKMVNAHATMECARMCGAQFTPVENDVGEKEKWLLTIAKTHPAWGLALLGLIHLTRVAQLRQAVSAPSSMVDRPSSAISQALIVGMPRLPIRSEVDLLLGSFDDRPLAAMVEVAYDGVQVLVGTLIVPNLVLSFIQ